MRHFKLLVLISFFCVSALSAAVFAAESETSMANYSDTYKDLNCAVAESAVADCKAAKDIRTLSFDFEIPNKTVQKNCAFMISLNKSCARKDVAGCKSERDEYNTVKRERDVSCSAVGGCNGGAFVRCEAFLEVENVEDFDDDAAAPIDRIAFVQACPFYAKGEKENKDAEIKSLDEEISTAEDELQKLQEKMTKDLETSETERNDMQAEVAKLEASLQSSYTDLNTELSGIDQSGTEEVTNIRNAISTLKSNIQLKSITENGKAVIEYQEQLKGIQEACYQFGLDAVRAEAARIRKGVSGNEAITMGAVGILQTAREKANAAYRQCQNKRMFKGRADAADQLYNDRQSVLKLNIDQTNDSIASLQEQFKNLPENMEQKKKDAIQKHMAAAQNSTAELQSKKQTLQMLMSTSQSNQMQMTQQMATKQMEQAKRSKMLRALKMDLSKIKQAATTTADGDKFAKAQGDNEALRSARIAAHHACCPSGTPLLAQDKGLCLSPSEKQAWDVEDAPEEDDATPSGTVKER